MDQLLWGVFGLLFVISLQANVFLFLKLRRSAKTPTPTVDAQKVLAAIASGSAVLRIHVLEPGDILLRSPRT